MNAKEKKLKSDSLKAVKDLKELETSKIVSDSELTANLDVLNIQNLIAKSAKNRSIWKNEFKLSYSDNEKTARRKIRAIQFSLSKKLLHTLLIPSSMDDKRREPNNLKNFYTAGLENFEIFSNVSETESPEKHKVIHLAYQKMNLLCK